MLAPLAINTYAYVGGNPVSFVDPSGLGPIAGAACFGVAAIYETASAGSDIAAMNEATAGLLDQLNRVSERLENCPEGPEGDETRQQLYAMQANLYSALGRGQQLAILSTIGGNFIDGLKIGAVCSALTLAAP